MSTVITPAPDLRHGINCLAFFAFALFLLRIFSGLNPQPEVLTDAVRAATDEKMNAFVVVTGVALFGLFALLRFILGAAVNGLASQAGGFVSWLCFLLIALLGAAVITPLTAEFTGVAVLAAMGSNWAVEAARDKCSSRPGA